MKKHWMIAIILVFTLSLFTGCGCTNQRNNGMNATEMTILPTTAPTIAVTEAATTATVPRATDELPTDMTIPMATETDRATEIPDGTAATGAAENRSRTVR